MNYVPKIVAFAGSTRTESYNKKLVRIAVASAGADVTYHDLRDMPLPFYDGDLEAEEGLPANARKWKDLLLAHHGLLISAPVQQLRHRRFQKLYRLGLAPESWESLPWLAHVRAVLGNIGVLVLPDQVAVPKAHEAFQPDGNLKDANM